MLSFNFFIALENPQLYYVNLKELSFSSNGIVYKYLPDYLLSKSQTDQIEGTIRGMLNAFRTDDEERTIRNVHNYLIKNIKYDYADETNIDLFNHSLVNVFTKQKGVCEGISFAFQYLLKLLDIECVSITGDLDGGTHSWNIVCVDGYNYHIDVRHLRNFNPTDGLNTELKQRSLSEMMRIRICLRNSPERWKMSSKYIIQKIW